MDDLPNRRIREWREAHFLELLAKHGGRLLSGRRVSQAIECDFGTSYKLGILDMVVNQGPELTSSVLLVLSKAYPELIAATKGKDGEVVYITDRLKFTSVVLIVSFPRIIAR